MSRVLIGLAVVVGSVAAAFFAGRSSLSRPKGQEEDFDPSAVPPGDGGMNEPPSTVRDHYTNGKSPPAAVRDELSWAPFAFKKVNMATLPGGERLWIERAKKGLDEAVGSKPFPNLQGTCSYRDGFYDDPPRAEGDYSPGAIVHEWRADEDDSDCEEASQDYRPVMTVPCGRTDNFNAVEIYRDGSIDLRESPPNNTKATSYNLGVGLQRFYTFDVDGDNFFEYYLLLVNGVAHLFRFSGCEAWLGGSNSR